MPVLKNSPEVMNAMTEILEQCFHTLELYGKEVESFPFVVLTFERFLGNYPADKIIPAFERYVQQKTKFPAPADIISIIEGRIKRDSAYYRELQAKRRGVGLTKDEFEYLAKYEKQTMNDWE